MQSSILAILSGLPNVDVQQRGTLWTIRVGGLTGSRRDGVALARDMRVQYEYTRPRPVIVETPVQVGHSDEPNDLEIPRFLAPPPVESVPTDLQALAEPGETTEQTRSRLWSLYKELQNKIMMALASREEVRLHEWLHNHMGWLAAADERKL